VNLTPGRNAEKPAIVKRDLLAPDSQFYVFVIKTVAPFHKSLTHLQAFNGDLAHNFSFTYAFINRFNREVGYDATDGQPPMHTHIANLVWSKRDQVRVSLYTLLLDYRSRPQFSLSTQTYGVRANGPYHFSADWSLIYTAEFAKQRNYGTNPNRVDVNYYLGELGPGWRGLELKLGYALLGGRSSTDELTTPLAPPRNGWTDLIFQ
jgi:hypothetical protein